MSLYSLVIHTLKPFFKLFYRHRVYGLENFVPGCAIIAANHVSFYDPPLIAISAPEELQFLARASLFRHRFFGKLIRALNAHPVSGGSRDAQVLRTVIKLLKEQKKVLLFPEGTRTEGDLKTVYAGVGLLSQKSGCPVIPTFIAGADKIWGRDRCFPKLWGRTSVTFCKPIYPKDYAHLDRKEGQIAIAEAFAKTLQEFRRQKKK